MATQAFEQFRYSFFEDPYSARDGLDEAALAELTGEERSEAERLLLDFLPDARAVIGLGVLRSQRAESRLAKLFDELPEDSRKTVYVATALWRIRPDPRWLAAIVADLGASDSFQRMDAAFALKEFYTPQAADALKRALDDDDSLVRHHAARGLLLLHGIDCPANEPEHMVYRVMSDDLVRREAAREEILTAVAARPIVMR